MAILILARFKNDFNIRSQENILKIQSKLEAITAMFRSFLKLHALCFIGLILIQPTFAETPKTKPASIIKKNTKTLNQNEANNFKYSHTFYREQKIAPPQGKPEIKREIVKQTISGEELVVVVNYTYTKNKPADKVIFTLPIPQEAIYVAGSATDEKYVLFSIDKGKTWSHYSDLRITNKNGTKRIATAKDITHLQWRITHTLKKGDTGTLEYKIIIR